MTARLVQTAATIQVSLDHRPTVVAWSDGSVWYVEDCQPPYDRVACGDRDDALEYLHRRFPHIRSDASACGAVIS